MHTPTNRRQAKTLPKGVKAATFFIDAQFLLRNTTETFWGAPLIVVDGKDSTFSFGFLRDLLRLRQALHISGGAVVLGREAPSFATEENIRSAAELCRELGIVVVQEPTLAALMIAAAHIDHFSNVVTDDRRMLQFCSERCCVHLGKDPRSLERMTPDIVQRTLGVPAEQVPTYLALTERTKQANDRNAIYAVTALEARRLVELHGDLSGIYYQLPSTKSPTLRKKLANNQETFEQRYRENTARPPEAPPALPRSLSWNLDGMRQESLLRQHGLHSLVRMLPLSERSIQLPEATDAKIQSSRSYQAVLNCREYNELLERVAHANVCAIDTEADGKDPHTATLFGISLALARGEAFFVPFCARDMGDLTPRTVQIGLKKVFKARTKFVGHNLKYDLTLLRRNGIEPPPVCFDTFLAAHDCYGDLDFFNLPFLSQKLLGRKIKAYKDIVPREKTFLELPFDEMKEHACTDADIALQLHALLEKELKERRISQQFEERTMPLARTLLDLEKHGVPVDGKRLEKLRSRLMDGMLQAKKDVSDAIGSAVDLDSQKEISVLMKEKLGLREILGRKSLTQSLLEQLASERPLLKLVVEYKRRGKQARRIESIIKAIRRGRIHCSVRPESWMGGSHRPTPTCLLMMGLMGCSTVLVAKQYFGFKTEEGHWNWRKRRAATQCSREIGKAGGRRIGS